MMRAYRRFSHIQILIPSTVHPDRWEFACGGNAQPLGDAFATTWPEITPSKINRLTTCRACIDAITTSRDQDGQWTHTPDGVWWWTCPQCGIRRHDGSGQALRQMARAHRLNQHTDDPPDEPDSTPDDTAPSLLDLLDGGEAA